MIDEEVAGTLARDNLHDVLGAPEYVGVGWLLAAQGAPQLRR